jgi:hypothetical protein
MSTPTPEERAADLRQNGFLWKDDAVERYVAGVIAEAERAGAERMRDALDPDRMRAAGWVRADDVRRAVRALREEEMECEFGIAEAKGAEERTLARLGLEPLPEDV